MPRKDPLSFQNPSFHHVNINNNDLIPIHDVSNKVNENKKLFDDLEESNNYLQESLGYPKLNHKGECVYHQSVTQSFILAEMTRDWLQNHNIDDASEIISYNNELETQLTRAKSEKDELSILNENLSEKCDMLTSQNSQLKAQLHGMFLLNL